MIETAVDAESIIMFWLVYAFITSLCQFHIYSHFSWLLVIVVTLYTKSFDIFYCQTHKIRKAQNSVVLEEYNNDTDAEF